MIILHGEWAIPYGQLIVHKHILIGCQAVTDSTSARCLMAALTSGCHQLANLIILITGYPS